METGLNSEQFHNLIVKSSGNTMIWAPRQSGKTTALVREFLTTPNSLFYTVNYGQKRSVERICYELDVPFRRNDIRIMNEESIRSYNTRTFFIDEIDHYDGDLYRLLVPISLTSTRMIAISTPHRPRLKGTYASIFESEYKLNHEGLTDWRCPESDIVITINVNNHFEREGELFRI